MWMLACTLILTSAAAAATPAAPTPPPKPTVPSKPASVSPWSAPPFDAWVHRSLTYVRREPKVPSELTGALRRGDRVRVDQCVPACDAPKAWAVLSERGAVPLAALRPLPEPDEALQLSAEATFTFGRVIRNKAPEFADADAKSRVVGRQKIHYLLAFIPDPPLLATGWLRHIGGGFMRAADVKISVPSVLQGEVNPKLPLAFVRRKWSAKPPPRDKSAPAVAKWSVHRYDRMPVLAERAGRVEVAGGWLPRGVVRIAAKRGRPAAVPPGAKWIFVDVDEQTVTAFEGSRAVYTTLVSTGVAPHETTRGTFRIYTKTRHSTMRGSGWADYVAEEVRWVMHFVGGEAFHEATWHDQFGIQKSHGCINMAPSDAAWLFDWVDPAIPKGWHTLLHGSRDPAVWVVVDHTPPTKPKQRRPELTEREGHQWGVDDKGARSLRIDVPQDGEQTDGERPDGDPSGDKGDSEQPKGQ